MQKGIKQRIACLDCYIKVTENNIFNIDNPHKPTYNLINEQLCSFGCED